MKHNNEYFNHVDNIFPDEIWMNIFDELNGRDITIISMTSKIMDQLIIKNKVKCRGFPRKVKNIDQNPDKFNNIVPKGKCVVHNFILIKNNFKAGLPKTINQVTNYLYDNNCNMVRGDIIHMSNMINHDPFYIFDGFKLIRLIPLTSKEENYILPGEFTIINDDIPINYWDLVENKIFRERKSPYYEYLLYILLWFDHSKIKEQCIRNINDDFTTFIYNNITYKIKNDGDLIKLLDDNKLLVWRKENELQLINHKNLRPIIQNNENRSYCNIL